MNTSCIVLAGGKSSRLGRDKLKEKIGQENLLQRVVNSLSVFDCDIILVMGQKATLPDYIDYPKLTIANDIYPGLGPMGGIYTGLKVSTSFYNLVVAGDMPFLNRDLLTYMMERIKDYDLLVPRAGDTFEPLHAVYTKNCLAPIEKQINLCQLSVLRLFSLVKTGYVRAEIAGRYDPGRRSFFNINTEKDLEVARGLSGDFGQTKVPARLINVY